MLIHQYRKEFCRPPNPEAVHLRCVAHLDGDLTEVLPYLNTVLKGHQFFPETPSLTLKFEAKLITLYPDQIAINIVKDEAEAEAILNWLQQKINDTWERRQEIQPCYGVAPHPRILDLLKLLPRTNCRQCGQPTCLVFATRLSQGVGSADDCPGLEEAGQTKLRDYLGRFGFAM
ncbi:MAG: (Fe-S)-binding protein [Desulfobacteraceae bacterium]